MQTEGIKDKRLVRLLEGYYSQVLGGPAAWEELSSLSFFGEVEFSDGSQVSVYSIKKKPYFHKMTFELPSGHRLISGYSGQIAWKTTPEVEEPLLMEAGEALGFSRDAFFGSHLLYPSMRGKKIEIVGDDQVDGSSVVVVRVTVSEFIDVQYFIDSYNCLIAREVLTNPATGETTTLDFRNFEKVQGVLIPLTVLGSDPDKRSYKLTLNEILPNAGAASWIFEYPTDGY